MIAIAGRGNNSHKEQALGEPALDVNCDTDLLRYAKCLLFSYQSEQARREPAHLIGLHCGPTLSIEEDFFWPQT